MISKQGVHPLTLSLSRQGRGDARNNPLPWRERVAAGSAGRRVRGSNRWSNRRTLLRCCVAVLLIAGFVFASGASARNRHDDDDDSFVPSRTAGTPLLAVVGLAEQRISIYDAKGKIMELPVSSGQTGYETPAGIYSIVQKEEEHYSNVYDDASMPFMERITWTGMALHSGVLPGYPASHGCVRLPYEFAERLYDVTSLGMRVIVAREEIAPAEIAQPFMFGSGFAGAKERVGRAYANGVSPATSYSYSSSDAQSQVRMTLAEKSAEAQNLARKARDLHVGASKRAAEAASAERALKAAEANLAKAEEDLKAAEHALEAGAPAAADQAAEAKAKALTKVNQAQSQLDAAKAEAQSKADAVAQAQADIKAADAAFAAAMDAADEARQSLRPVSVFISRKTQRLYIRKGNMPVFEAPVMIRDRDKPIGSFVFTALDYNREFGRTAMECRLDVQGRDEHRAILEGEAGRIEGRREDPPPADVAGAEAALSRLTLTQESIDRISEVVLPGSSLIVSDEGPSIETGKDTDFVVFMSGEPQGGIAIRAHHHEASRGGWYGEDWFGAPPARGERYRNRGGWGGGGGGGPFGFPF